MKREWSGCVRRRCTLGRYRIPYRRRSVPRRRVVLLRGAFQHPARPRPTRSDALPANSSVRRTGLVVASGRTIQTRHRQAAHRSGEAPVRALQVRKRPAVGATMARTSLRNIRKMPQRAGPAKGRFPMGLRRQGRRVRLRPDHGVQLATLVSSGIAAFRQAAPAARPASCAPRPHCERPGRHCAAWRCSPPYCGWSPPCRASSRKQRMAIRSRQGAAR